MSKPKRGKGGAQEGVDNSIHLGLEVDGKGGWEVDRNTGDGRMAQSGEAKSIHLPSTSIHLPIAKNPMEIIALSTSSTSSLAKGYEGVKRKKEGLKNVKGALGEGRGEEVDEVDRTGPPQPPVKRYVAIAENGRQRVGEDHANAKLTDDQVERMRDLHEAGEMGYRRLAKEFGCSKRTVRDIVNFNRRNQWPAKWKRLTRPS